MHQLFISKSATELPLLDAFCQKNNISLIAESLISFERVVAEIPTRLDIVFFTSPRSVDFFLDQVSTSFTCNDFACMGKGTEKALINRGHQSSFTGEYSSFPEKVFIPFKSWAGSRLITVPRSSQSLFSISKYFSTQQLIFIEVYKTNFIKKNISECSIYIFTSPSNVDSYLLLNTFPQNTKVYAWGASTKARLLEKGILVNETLTFGQESQLIRMLNLY
ncbi:MAG: uroporphyrinogen-III synthase [Crocinitomicaceae bacterium]